MSEATKVKAGQVWARRAKGTYSTYFRVTSVDGSIAHTEPVMRDETARRALFGEWTFDCTGRLATLKVDRLTSGTAYRLVNDA